jgi:hypothetical protein
MWCRYYMYGQSHHPPGVVLVEMIVSTIQFTAAVTVKSELPAALTEQFVELFKMCLSGFVR